MSPLGSHQRIFHVYTAILLLVSHVLCSQAFSIRELVRGGKRADNGVVNCPPWHPFLCPSGDCIPFKYICDGSADCSDSYDENKQLCTAALRPPVEETSQFFSALLNAHKKDFFVPLFGHRAKNSLAELGGIDKVSVAISESPSIDDFAAELKLTEQEAENMREILEAIAAGLPSALNENESADFRFFVQKLKETGFF